MEFRMVLPAHRDPMVVTIDEFLMLELPDGKAELVRGEVRVTPPPGAPHATAASNLLVLLAIHARANGLGRVYGGSFGYDLTRLPHTVRVPDLSFVRAERLPRDGVGPGLLKLAPDLAVEVLSPSETASSLEEKLDDYAAAGTPLVWVVDPIRRTVMVVATNAPVKWLREGDALDGGEIVAGFSCAVADIFEGIAR
jgi:Uma2 family endonuclease